jgi:hypothetical protein
VIEELTSRMENCDIHFTGMLSYVNWWLVAEISGHLMGPVLKGEAALKDGTYSLSRNGGD